MSLVLEFSGWCVIRLATDPDPPDEPWGSSGYTFAFPGEPPLDRVVRFQPTPEFIRDEREPREWGVRVREATSIDRTTGKRVSVGGLVEARVDLCGDPKLENRNGTLTPAGYEPIVPFDLQITSGDVTIRRAAPLDPKQPSRPIWEVASATLAEQGANGFNVEPDTVGEATGIWDPLAVIVARRAWLLSLPDSDADPEQLAARRGRVAELELAIRNPDDRRVYAHTCVERFGFPMTGSPGTVDVSAEALDGLGGKLDVRTAWDVAFWLGAWDADLMCAWAEGSLVIPYTSERRRRAIIPPLGEAD